MKIPSYIKKSIYSGFTFFLTVLILSIWYGALSWGLSLSDKVGTGSWLTANSWNKIVDGIIELDTRTLGIYSTGGHVGIGTTNPSTLLHITNAGGYGAVALGPNNSVGSIISSEINGDMGFWSGPFGTGPNRVMIKQNGNVGIWTTSPAVRLDVAGSIHVSGDMGKVCVTRDSVDTTWANCPADHPNWIIWFNGMNVASPEYNYWHTSSSMWICCK